MLAGMIWPVVALIAMVVTQIVKTKITPKFWQTTEGTQCLRLVPVSVGVLIFMALGRAGVIDLGGLDMEAIWGLGTGGAAIAAFHATKQKK